MELAETVVELPADDCEAHQLAIGITPSSPCQAQQTAFSHGAAAAAPKADARLKGCELTAIAADQGQLTQQHLDIVAHAAPSIDRAVDQAWGAVDRETIFAGGTEGAAREVAIQELDPIATGSQGLALEIDAVGAGVRAEAVAEPGSGHHGATSCVQQPEAGCSFQAS